MYPPIPIERCVPHSPSSTPNVSPTPHRLQNTEDAFHFHPRASNPELWRTSLPLIVSIRCDSHKGLVATWMAIHWLIVLHASNGRSSFGLREIAKQANVGRNELAGTHGYIQRLVQLDLIQIVGYQHLAGLREPRPIYHIDLVELERLSIEYVPHILRQHAMPPPPRPAPDPRQLHLFDEPTPTHETVHHLSQSQGSPLAGSGEDEQHPVTPPLPLPRTGVHQTGIALHEPGAVMRDTGTVTSPNGFDVRRTERALSATGTVVHAIGTEVGVHKQGMPLPRTGVHRNRTVLPETGTVDARNRDMEGKRDGKKEGVSEILHQHQPSLALDMQQLTSTIAQVVIQTLRSHGLMPPVPVPDTPVPMTVTTAPLTIQPRTPEGAPPLPASPLAIWQGDADQISQRDQHQLALLSAEYDAKTNGYGAYWLGRAILAADTCLREKGRALTLNYIRGILSRWSQDDQWGSDLLLNPLPLPERSSRRSQHDATEGGVPAAKPPDLPVPSTRHETLQDAPPPQQPQRTETHAAVALYTTTLGKRPNTVQIAQIAATVTDLGCWQRVLTEWQANGWKATAVAKMLDRYGRETGLTRPIDAEPPPSARVIHYYPGLTMDERDLWIRRYHRAETPTEKRAVLAWLEREHPHDQQSEEVGATDMQMQHSRDGVA